MGSNTLKTVGGFFRAVLERRTPFKRASDSVEDIFNFLPIEGLYATSGQPSEAQFDLIKSDGYEVVINLAPKSVLENSVVNEKEILEGLDVTYIHIPVDFKNPTDADFEQFTQSLHQNENRKIWVHCAANMRVSAFTYRYRRTVLGEDRAVADADLRKIWDPLGVWKSFIAK